MPLSRLDFKGVRNLEETSLRALGQINLIVGANGSGKTSLLECIYLLGMARSFRSAHIRNVIQHGADTATVYGEVQSEQGVGRKLGVSRDRTGDLDARLDGQRLNSRSDLAEALPLQLIDTDSFTLLTEGPRYRRQFLDWGVFHVEHQFFSAWQRFQRAIKQRNTLLRHGKISDLSLAPWEAEMAEAGSQIHEARMRYLERLTPGFHAVIQRIAPDLGTVDLSYRPGWDIQLDLGSALEKNRQSDAQQGFTQVGPQRADIRILSEGKVAAEVLSRGQQKLVVCALKLAQGKIASEGGQQAIFLVDDLSAELDERHYRLVAGELLGFEAQLFVTSIEDSQALDVWRQPQTGDWQMFHVEHGHIEQVARS